MNHLFKLSRMTLALCCVGLFAASAVFAASASAAEIPTYKVCKTKKDGAYEKGCAKLAAPGKGKAELEEVEEPASFTGTGKTTDITAAGKKVTCKKAAVAGTIQFGEGTAEDHYTFTDCGVTKKEPCTTAGEASGTIKTARLDTQLYYLNSAETELALLAGVPTGNFAAFTCGSETVEIKGNVAGSIVNGKKGTTVTFAVSGGTQEHTTWYAEGNAFSDGLEAAGKPATLSVVLTDGPVGVGAYGA